MYLKGYELENSKNMLLHQFDDPLPWKQSKMAAKHNYVKSLRLQSDCMQITFLFTVRTNVMLSSLLPRILWLLCFFFVLFYYLHVILVKMIPIRTHTLLEYFHSFIIRKHGCTGKFKGSMYVMLFRSYLSNQTTLRLRQREGLFYTLLESSKRQQIIMTTTKNETKNKQN